MTDRDNNPNFDMPPPQHASSNSDINNVRPQLPMNNERYEPSSSLDRSHSFESPRISDNSHSNAFMGPPSRMNHPPPNTQMDNIFFKTRICENFGVGNCRNGEYCSYAHAKEELRQPPPNWQELERLQLGMNRDDYNLLQQDTAKFRNDSLKTRESSAITITPIGNNLEGTEEQLQLGGNRDNYSFRYEDTAKFDSWETRESSAITVNTIGNNLEDNKTGTKPPRGTYYYWKTKICHKWKDGSCSLGDYCNYAHGDADLQVPGRGIKTEAAVAIANSTKTGIPTLRTTGSSAKYEPTLPASLAMANSSKSVIPTTLRTTDSSATYEPALPASVPSAAEEEKKAKKELLWKKLNKINLIYGDWIDDLPPDRP